MLAQGRTKLHGNVGRHLGCLGDRWQGTGVFGQSRPLCVIAAIVLLLGDDRWKSLQ